MGMPRCIFSPWETPHSRNGTVSGVFGVRYAASGWALSPFLRSAYRGGPRAWGEPGIRGGGLTGSVSWLTDWLSGSVPRRLGYGFSLS